LATAAIAAFGKRTVHIKMERQSPSAPKCSPVSKQGKIKHREKRKNNEKNAEILLCSSLS
jgi:hypothetical protein